MSVFERYVEKKRRGNDGQHMQLAIEAAESAKSQGEQARGAVLVFPNMVLSESQSSTNESDPTCHAEMNVIRKAAQTQRRAFREGVLYSTTEPCAMCAAAAIQAGIREMVFGAYDHVNGFATAKRLNLEGVDVNYLGGLMADKCYEIAAPSLREHLRVSEDETPAV